MQVFRYAQNEEYMQDECAIRFGCTRVTRRGESRGGAQGPGLDEGHLKLFAADKTEFMPDLLS